MRCLRGRKCADATDRTGRVAGGSRRARRQNIVHEVLRSPGRPLDPAARAFFEPRFGRDLSAVRVHDDARAAESAKAVGALAYAVGTHIVTGPDPGRRRVAHELGHVVQQTASPGVAPVLRRQSWTERAGAWYDKKKWAVYHALINALRGAKNAARNLGGVACASLPAWAQGPITTIIDIADFFSDLVFALCLAITGLAVGFVEEALLGLITGLVKLAYCLLKLIADMIAAVFGKGEAFRSDLGAIAAAARNLLPGSRRGWPPGGTATRRRAGRPGPMGAELVGEIEAFLATFALAGTKGAQAG